MKTTKYIPMASMLLLMIARLEADLTVRIADEPQQKFAGWGVVVSDELSMNFVDGQNYGKKNLVLSGLKPNLVGIGLHEDWYNNDADNGSLDSGNLRIGLMSKLQAMKSAGISSYITFEDGVPPALTRNGALNSFDREVPPERENDHVTYLLNLFQAVKKAGYALPVAHSLYVPAEQSRQRALGTAPYGDNWRETGSRLQSRFSDIFKTKLKLLGPDAPSDTDSVARIVGSRSDPVFDPQKPFLPSGFNLAFGDSSLVMPTARDAELFRSICANASAHGTEIWMTGWFPPTARTEREACVEAAQRIALDMTEHKTNYWFWESGYTNAHTTTALVWGDGKTTMLYGFFKILWSRVLPGFNVRTVKFMDPGGQESNGSAHAKGIAFDRADRVVLLLSNSTNDTEDCELDLGGVKELTEYCYPPTNADGSGIKLPIAATGTFRLTLPASSVLLLEMLK